MRIRKPLRERIRSSCILLDEAAECFLSRLAKAGFEAAMVEAPSYSLGKMVTWSLSIEGSFVARMDAFSTEDGAKFVVMSNGKMFSHKFNLHKTDSPRRVACLLISWLRQAQVCQVMTA